MATHLSFPSPEPAPQTAAPDRKAADLGELLRTARERRRLTLQQVSDDTKIPLRYLDALERNNLDALPKGLYRRAQVRAYARAVRLDPRVAIERLERDMKAAAPVAATPVRPPKRDAVVMSPNRVIIGIGILLAAALVGHVLGRRGPAQATSPGRNITATSQRRPAPVAPVATDAVVATSLRSSSPSAAVSDAAPAVTVATAPAVKAETAPAASQAPVPALPANAIADQQAAPQPAATVPPEGSGSQLIVTSEPAGAQVTVDGIGWGTTPVTIRYIPPGDKKVRVSRDGYAATERTVQIDDRQQKKVSIQLHPVP